MSGLLGMLKTNGEPVYKQELSKMMGGMEKFGPDGGMSG